MDRVVHAPRRFRPSTSTAIESRKAGVPVQVVRGPIDRVDDPRTPVVVSALAPSSEDHVAGRSAPDPVAISRSQASSTSGHVSRRRFVRTRTRLARRSARARPSRPGPGEGEHGQLGALPVQGNRTCPPHAMRVALLAVRLAAGVPLPGPRALDGRRRWRPADRVPTQHPRSPSTQRLRNVRSRRTLVMPASSRTAAPARMPGGRREGAPCPIRWSSASSPIAAP